MKSVILPSGTMPAIALALMLALISACSSSSTEDPAEPTVNPADDVPGEPATPVGPSEPATPSEPTTPTTPAEPNDPLVLEPPVDENSDLGRLLEGIHRQVEATLLDLNQRLNSGVLLTDQQNQCLGSYDPSVGESLTSISCEQPLATDEIAIYVERASFFNTAVCQADLFNGSGNNCTVMLARITVPTTFEIPANSSGDDGFVPQRPQAVAGAEIYYAIEDTLLRVENNPSMLTGVFRCDYDLETGLPVGSTTTANCDNVIANTANRLDTLRPASP